MSPTIPMGETVLVDLRAYRYEPPARWDIVFLERPSGDSAGGRVWALRRVWGLPGETIAFSNGVFLVEGVAVSVPPDLAFIAGLIREHPPGVPFAVTFPVQLGTNAYFLLGDNVTNSWDSRYYGPQPRDRILGKVIGKSPRPTPTSR